MFIWIIFLCDIFIDIAKVYLVWDYRYLNLFLC